MYICACTRANAYIDKQSLGFSKCKTRSGYCQCYECKTLSTSVSNQLNVNLITLASMYVTI